MGEYTVDEKKQTYEFKESASDGIWNLANYDIMEDPKNLKLISSNGFVTFKQLVVAMHKVKFVPDISQEYGYINKTYKLKYFGNDGITEQCRSARSKLLKLLYNHSCCGYKCKEEMKIKPDQD